MVDMVLNNLIIRHLGLQPYEKVLLDMRYFTQSRTVNSIDEIWLVQHPRIFTQGQMGKIEHLLSTGDIPVIQSDRGGQVTFHAPGQQIMYVMLDLHRRNINVRRLVTLLEEIVISTLSHFLIHAHRCTNFPGVYVGNDKICSLGLRISRGCSFHGIALNVDMDLTPFLRINPCGHIGLQMTQVNDLVPGIRLEDIRPILINKCLTLLLNATNPRKI